MIGLGDPERIVIDCAGDKWYVRGPDGAVRSVLAPAEVDEFAAPALAARRWSQWLTDAVSGSAPSRSWVVLAPSVFGAPRRSLIEAAAGSLGVAASILPRAEALVRTGGVLYCRRALVLECRGPIAQAHVLALTDGAWRAVAAASHPDPVRAARVVFDDDIDQALVDGPPEAYRTVRAALATAGLWRVVRVDPEDVLAVTAPEREPEASGPPSREPPERAIGHRARRRWPLLVAGAGTVGVVAASAVACLPESVPSAPERPAPPAESFVRVAFDGASVDLPREWAVTEPGPDRRLAEAGDGRRVTVVRTRLRAPSDTAAVAADLEAALGRRSDQRISDLNPSTRVGGREVIGYRERIDAERFVDWYVVVAGAAQLSVGCEAGRSAAPLAGACERAVGTVQED
ncbi:type VII secretion-associated protein [Tsukamurella sputi]|uniref:Type VII secretion-associated protein n=1 Tax=Tsukamurella sputi TaxID=2591848 RepID=A0A5C5RL19_9ACTN|nr:type VII secretion-associated protein [Tsukamurella sputi]TWS23420.1 type VII secretion-associated protein [Tsukamurella sputi]